LLVVVGQVQQTTEDESLHTRVLSEPVLLLPEEARFVFKQPPGFVNPGLRFSHYGHMYGHHLPGGVNHFRSLCHSF
jgi:hypothetical protein